MKIKNLRKIINQEILLEQQRLKDVSAGSQASDDDLGSTFPNIYNLSVGRSTGLITPMILMEWLVQTLQLS